MASLDQKLNSGSEFKTRPLIDLFSHAVECLKLTYHVLLPIRRESHCVASCYEEDDWLHGGLVHSRQRQRVWWQSYGRDGEFDPPEGRAEFHFTLCIFGFLSHFYVIFWVIYVLLSIQPFSITYHPSSCFFFAVFLQF